MPMQPKKIAATPLACALIAAWCVLTAPLAHANYRAKAIEATDSIQRTFYDADAGLYRPSFPAKAGTLPYDFMWGNGVQFSALVGATRYEPARYKPVLYRFAHGLERYWDKDALVPGFDAYFSSKDGDDKYYDDNAWLVLGFAEAYRVTKDPFFLDWARRTNTFVLSGLDGRLGGGIYWHQQKKNGKNTCVNAPAATSEFELYNIEKKPEDFAMGTLLYAWTTQHLQDPQDGLYWDNINLDGKIEKTKWTYNTALMIRASLGLWRVTKEKKYLAEARRVADASLKKWQDPATGAFADSPRFNHLLGEALLQTYEATKDVKYLNAVRRHADFGYRSVRDFQNGGYWDKWRGGNHLPDERKTLIENASVARLYWLLVPYDDVEELQAKGEAAIARGDKKAALNFFEQALASTAGAPPTTAPPATAPPATAPPATAPPATAPPATAPQ